MTDPTRVALERAVKELERVAGVAARCGLDASARRARNEARAARTALAEARRVVEQPAPLGLIPMEYVDADSSARIVSEPSEDGPGGCWVVRNSRHVNPCTEFPTAEAAWDALQRAQSRAADLIEQQAATVAALAAAPPEPVGEGEELAQWLEHLADLRRRNHHVRPSASALTRTATLIRQLAARAAALQQPAPGERGLTDEELKAAYWEAFHESAMCGAEASWLAGLRAVARATITALQQPAPLGEGLSVQAATALFMETYATAPTVQCHPNSAMGKHQRQQAALAAVLTADRQRRAQPPQGEEVQP